MNEAPRKRPGTVVTNAAARPAGPAYILEDAGPARPGAEVASDELRARVIAALRTVRDPELPVNVYDLGLVYGIEVGADGSVELSMTLTAPACPVAGQVIAEVHEKVRAVLGAGRVRTELVWEPAWTAERLSTAAKLELGLL